MVDGTAKPVLRARSIASVSSAAMVGMLSSRKISDIRRRKVRWAVEAVKTVVWVSTRSVWRKIWRIDSHSAQARGVGSMPAGVRTRTSSCKTCRRRPSALLIAG